MTNFNSQIKKAVEKFFQAEKKLLTDAQIEFLGTDRDVLIKRLMKELDEVIAAMHLAVTEIVKDAILERIK